MATRYKVTKEQVEKLVENFVSEAASPEAKKHIQGSVENPKVGHSVKTRDNRSGGPQAADAKKHIKNSLGSNMVEKRPNTPKATEVEPGSDEDELNYSTDAKKHIKK